MECFGAWRGDRGRMKNEELFVEDMEDLDLFIGVDVRYKALILLQQRHWFKPIISWVVIPARPDTEEGTTGVTISSADNTTLN